MNEYRLSSEGALGVNSTGGKLLKWKVGNKFIKTSTLDNTSLYGTKFMYESISEVIVSKIGKALGYNVVDYKLCKVVIDNNIECIACESVDFTGGGNYISFGKLILENNLTGIQINAPSSYNKLLYYLNRSCNGVRGYIDSNIVLDYIILNDDRHFGNLGLILRDGKIVLAPIFDNGNGLLGHKHIDGIKYDSSIAKVLRCKPFHYDFDRQLSLVEELPNIDKSKVKSVVVKELDHMLKGNYLNVDRASFINDLIVDRLDNIVSR